MKFSLQNGDVDGIIPGVYDGYTVPGSLLDTHGGFTPSTGTPLAPIEDPASRNTLLPEVGDRRSSAALLTQVPDFLSDLHS